MDHQAFSTNYRKSRIRHIPEAHGVEQQHTNDTLASRVGMSAILHLWRVRPFQTGHLQRVTLFTSMEDQFIMTHTQGKQMTSKRMKTCFTLRRND